MMKKRKSRLPRKMKKAMSGLLISEDGMVFFNGWFRWRRYPRTRWVVRAERQFRRVWRESKRRDRKIAELSDEAEELEAAIAVMNFIVQNGKIYEEKEKK
ncbi:MAG: hypothetical protein J5953_13320 [Prevotella sp.]|nr:hypothetical protein [Prevotella sp.]